MYESQERRDPVFQLLVTAPARFPMKRKATLPSKADTWRDPDGYRILPAGTRDLPDLISMLFRPIARQDAGIQKDLFPNKTQISRAPGTRAQDCCKNQNKMDSSGSHPHNPSWLLGAHSLDPGHGPIHNWPKTDM